MKRACPICDRVHGGDWAIAVFRFGPDASVYRAASDRNAPRRATRDEAVADECALRAKGDAR